MSESLTTGIRRFSHARQSGKTSALVELLREKENRVLVVSCGPEAERIIDRFTLNRGEASRVVPVGLIGYRAVGVTNKAEFLLDEVKHLRRTSQKDLDLIESGVLGRVIAVTWSEE
jgi:hypothetical protein